MSIKKYLKQFSKEDLTEQIIELHKKFKDVKTYYEFTLNPDGNAQAEKIKKIIYKLFNPPPGQGPRLREARKEVNGFKKLSPPEEAIADVMLHYVECGVQFTNNYGDINEPFYNSVAGKFHDAGYADFAISLLHSLAQRKIGNTLAIQEFSQIRGYNLNN